MQSSSSSSNSTTAGSNSNSSGNSSLPLRVSGFDSPVTPFRICGGQSGTGTGFSPSPSEFARQYHSAIAVVSAVKLSH